MAYYFWVLRRGGETILVDTGFDPAVGARRGRTCLLPAASRRCERWASTRQTSRRWSSPISTTTTSGTSPPSRTRSWSSRERSWSSGPGRGESAPVRIARRAGRGRRLDEARRPGRVRLTDGTEQIPDGVTAIFVGGHSPGQQVTVVTGAAGDVVLTSDAVHFYEELEPDRPVRRGRRPRRMYGAFDLVNELGAAPGAVIVPGHDPEVMARFPSFGDRASGLPSASDERRAVDVQRQEGKEVP